MAPKKTNLRIRPARSSSGGLRSRSSFLAMGRDGCFGTRDVYYAAAVDATRPRLSWPVPESQFTTSQGALQVLEIGKRLKRAFSACFRGNQVRGAIAPGYR